MMRVVEIREDGRLVRAELRCSGCPQGCVRYVRTAQDVQVLRRFALGLLELADALDQDRDPVPESTMYPGRPLGWLPSDEERTP